MFQSKAKAASHLYFCITVGHLLPLEAPEEVAKAVRDFIRNR